MKKSTENSFLFYAGIRKFLVTLFMLILIKSVGHTQELPIGYISYFSHKGNHKSFFNSWYTDKPGQWKIIPLKSGTALSGMPEDTLTFSSFPETRGILSNQIFGDYILEFEFKTTFTDTSAFHFLGPVKTSTDYYTVAFKQDTLLFFYIDDGFVYRIDAESVSLKQNDWNKVKIIRDILTRQLRITVNKDLSKQIIFSDRNLVMGYIGFGTHQATSYLKNIEVWAPTSIIDSTFVW
jgi:hypothetical protein